MILMLSFMTGSAFSQGARLSYNLVPGYRYKLDIDIQQNTSSESLNSEEISMYSRMKLDFEVDSTDHYGLVHITVQYTDLLLSMLAPGLAIDINSETGENPLLSELMDTLKQHSFRLAMFASGELHSVDGIDQIFHSMAAYPARDSNELAVNINTLEEAYGSNAFKSLFNLFIAYFPAIQPIKNWTRDITYYFNTKPVKMVNRYYLSKTTNDVITIQGMGMLNSLGEYSETVSLGLVKSSVSGSQTFDYLVDANTGWLKKCVSRQRVLIETTIVKSTHFPEGLMIPSFTETVFDVKGTVQSQKSL
ncbi:MAG: DUF6263 family protein [Bacteroidota bacterium]